MPTIRESYEAVLSSAIESGRIEVLRDELERRKHPRLRIPFGLLKAEEIIPRDMTDISLGGFAFEATRPYTINDSVNVNLRSKVGAAAKVVGCDPLGNGSTATAMRYRVRCRFNDEEEAMLLLGLALQIGDSESTASDPDSPADEQA